MALSYAVFNADDFGRRASINAAVIRAHREGVLTSASLMVAGEAADEAVELARESPKLAVGLHLVCADGRAALPAAEIPHIVDAAGHFPPSATLAGLRYFFSRIAREELARELEAQFQRFAETGLPLSHVDGHHHLHIHPSVFPLILPLAERYGAKGVRLPRDDLWLGLGLDRRRLATKLAWYISHSALSAKCLRMMSESDLALADRVYGLLQSGCMYEEYVLKVLSRSHAFQVELYFHPDVQGHPEDPFGPNPGDLATLLSPRLRALLEEGGVELATYADFRPRRA